MKTMRLLVLPGIGDIYWVMVKLQAFLQSVGADKAVVDVWDLDSRPRGIDFLQRIPFVEPGQYFKPPSGITTPEFRESYMTGPRSVFPGYCGYDYYLAVNGALRVGKSLDDAMPGLASDWHFSMMCTDKESEYMQWISNRHGLGEYIVVHLSDFGMFRQWVQAWNVTRCVRFLTEISKLTNKEIILTGSTWDASFTNVVAARLTVPHTNLVGKTDPDYFYALFRNAGGCVGWCGGNTILATAFKVPTMILWSGRQFAREEFFYNACSPEGLHHWYEYRVVEKTPDEVQAARDFVGLLQRAEDTPRVVDEE